MNLDFRYFVLVLSILLGFSALSQTDGHLDLSVQKVKMDTNYIEDLSDRLNLYIFGKSKYNHFTVNNLEDKSKLTFAPNDRFNIGFGFNYKWLGLGVAFNLPFVNNDDDIYGKTERFDAQMNIYTHKFLVDFYFNRYKGFYIQNPDVIDSTFKIHGNYPIYPNLESFDVGGAFFFLVNNKKFSYRASFIQNERQKKMAGSLVLGFIAHFNLTSNDTNIVPYEFVKDLEVPSDYMIRTFGSGDLGPMIGYAFNFLIRKKLMITLSVVPGIVWQRQTAHAQREERRIEKNQLGLVMSNKVAITYNGQFFYYGLNYNDFHSVHNYKEISTTSNIGNFRLFFGRRFDLSKLRHKKQTIKSF